MIQLKTASSFKLASRVGRISTFINSISPGVDIIAVTSAHLGKASVVIMCHLVPRCGSRHPEKRSHGHTLPESAELLSYVAQLLCFQLHRISVTFSIVDPPFTQRRPDRAFANGLIHVLLYKRSKSPKQSRRAGARRVYADDESLGELMDVAVARSGPLQACVLQMVRMHVSDIVCTMSRGYSTSTHRWKS